MKQKNNIFQYPLKNVAHIVKIMKITVFLCFISIFSAVAGDVHSQGTEVSVKVENVTIGHLFSQIERSSNYVFLVSDEATVQLNRKINLNVHDEEISKVMDTVLKNTNLSYLVKGRQITVFLKNKELETPVRRSVDQQKITVTGTVKDASFGEPLMGVNIREKNTNTGVISDVNGKYSIAVSNPNAVLVFSFIGFVTHEVSVKNSRIINVELREDAYQTDEVVVIAYGSAKKASVTGALSSISNEQLTRVPSTSLTNTLAGILPGAATVQTSGQPGKDAAQIFIRGKGSLNSSSPLVMVDGVEREFSQIDPSEIENISVLKDASSTAVFGVRGANGVILVTTRRGRVGAPSVSVSSTFGLQQPLSLIEAANSYDYARFWNMRQAMDGRTNVFTPEQIEKYRTGSDPIMYPDISWKDYMFNKTFLQSQNNVNISGGNEQIKYFVSLGYLYQNGLLKQFSSLPYDNNYKYNRYNYRGNIDAKLTKTTSMKLGIGGYVRDIQEPLAVENVDWKWTVAQVWAQPFAGPGIINGKRTAITRSSLPTDELRDGLFTFYGYGYRKEYETTLNVDVDITQKLDFITKGLTVSAKAAYDNNFNINKYRSGQVETQNVFYKSTITDPSLPEIDPHFDKTLMYTPVGRDVPLSYSESYDRGRKWYVEGRLNYERSFGNHNVTGLFLYNQSRFYYPDKYMYLPRGYIGWVGRATYNYRTTYLFDINMGYNGSENFAPGNKRYGLFPAVSAGWVATNEKFMQKQNVISYMKLRASWGKVGSDLDNEVHNSSRFLYAPGAWAGGGSYSFGVNNPVGADASYMEVPGNRNVTWETAEKQNYGIDINFFRDRLSFNFDYFIEHRTGILLVPNMTPGIIGTSFPRMNIGVVDNKGFEIVVGWKDTYKDFSYFIDGNVSFARNKIINMDEIPNSYSYQDITGGSTNRQTGMYKFLRMYQYDDFIKRDDGNLILNPDLPQPYIQVYPGDAMYADLNGDNVVDSDDTMTYGYSSRPEYVFGLNMGFNYKGLGLTMNWVGATNVAKMLEEDYRTPFTTAGARGLINYFAEECWTPENQFGATLPRPAVTTRSWNNAKSTLWLQDASYLRLKTISLTYTLKGIKPLKKLGIETMMFNLSAYNLLTFTKLKHLDPEANTQNNGEYPIVKTYNLGVTLNF